VGAHWPARESAAEAYSELAVAEAVGQQFEAAKRRKGYR